MFSKQKKKIDKILITIFHFIMLNAEICGALFLHLIKVYRYVNGRVYRKLNGHIPHGHAEEED